MVEKKRIRLEDLTDFQKNKINELRQRLKEDLKRYPEYDTDFSMLRWLQGWDYNVDAIYPKAKWAISLFDNLGCNDISFETTEQVNRYVYEYDSNAEFFPGGLAGQDNDGNVIFVQPLGRAHPKTLIKMYSVSGLSLLHIAMCEGAFKICRAYEAKHGVKCGLKIIMDLDGFAYTEHMYMPAIKEYMKMLSLLQQIFPDFLLKLWVVNAPTTVQMAYAVIKPVLAKQTIEKIVICGKDWKQQLIDSCGAENLYPAWGGTKPADKPHGPIFMGGKVPEKFWYTPETNPFDDENAMESASVSARNKHEVRFHAKQGDTIHWLFRVSSGDIDFSIHHNGSEVYPVLRVSTEHVPEKGKVVARYTGEYVAIFDNGHGKIWSKEIKHRIEARTC